MVIILRNYRSMNNGNYEVYINKVHERCASNSQFTSSKTTVTSLGKAIRAYELAQIKLPGNKAQTIERNERKAEVNDLLDKLVREVEILAGKNPQVALDAGMEVRNTNESISSDEGLPKPIFKKVANGINSGDVKLNWTPVKGAVAYAIEKSVDGGATWTNGQYPSGSRIVLKGFEPGTNVRIRVKAIGTRDRKSDVAETSLWIS